MEEWKKVLEKIDKRHIQSQQNGLKSENIKEIK